MHDDADDHRAFAVASSVERGRIGDSHDVAEPDLIQPELVKLYSVSMDVIS